MRRSCFFFLLVLSAGCSSSTGFVISALDGGPNLLGPDQPVDCTNGPNYTNCPCSLGDVRACYTGPAGTEGVGSCRAGTQTCVSANELNDVFGACIGESTPGTTGGCAASSDAGPAQCQSSVSPPTTPQTLVSIGADEVLSVGVVGCNLYYSLIGSGIYSVPTSGGAPTHLVSNPIPGANAGDGTFGDAPLAFDTSSVYFTYVAEASANLSDSLFRAPLSGGAPVQIDSMAWPSDVQFVGVAVASDDVYWAAQADGTIFRAPVTGGGATAVVSGLSLPRGAPGAIAVSGGTIFMSDPAGDLFAIPVGGGTPTTLYAGPALTSNSGNISGAGASGLVVDDANVYFTFCPFDPSASAQPLLMRIPRAGGSPTVLANSCAMGIAVDAANVYWIGSENGGTVEEIPISGGTARVLASEQYAAVGPAVDATSVYWGTAKNTGTCEGCPPPQYPGANAVWWVAK